MAQLSDGYKKRRGRETGRWLKKTVKRRLEFRVYPLLRDLFHENQSRTWGRTRE